MEQPEQKSKEQVINELAALRQQLSDLEERVANIDLGLELLSVETLDEPASIESLGKTSQDD